MDTSAIPSASRLDPVSGFQELIQHRVNDILLVASLYDAFILAQDGHLEDLITSEFTSLNLYHSPELTRVSQASRALEMLAEGHDCDLILVTMNPGDMHVLEFAQCVHELEIRAPVILLAYDSRGVNALPADQVELYLDRVFLWQGDSRILLAIVKYVEDYFNVDHDTRVMGVQTVILIEDSLRFYSSYLPIIYTEIVEQAHRLIDEGLNLAHKMLRMRARPKILLCTTYEEAWDCFTLHRDHLLGVITDLDFRRGGVRDPHAGLEFIRAARAEISDIPIMLQSSDPEIERYKDELRIEVAGKRSRNLLDRLRRFMRHHFGFGDFIFRLPDGSELCRARDLYGVEDQLATVPSESVVFHANQDHFSTWLKARTEFALARSLKVQKAEDFESPQVLREHLIRVLREYRQERSRGLVAVFNRETFDPENSFAQIGRGSMGGKARGLSFVRHLISKADLRDRFQGVRIAIPPMVVLRTEVFEQFMEFNDLKEFALECDDDDEIRSRFLEAAFPPVALIDLRHLIKLMDCPVAVRSSSLLEDSQYQPFAGVYDTLMLPNNHPDWEVRLSELVSAIKLVYASTYSSSSKGYILNTPYRLEEEAMAVIVQRIQGRAFGDLFYPEVAGVARSYNYYPMEPAQPEEGICTVALGLGQTVAAGRASLRFCPKHPERVLGHSRPKEQLQYSQNDFFAVDLAAREPGAVARGEALLRLSSVSRADEDGSLAWVASVYSPENDAVYDGLSRPGVRFVTFAPILKHGAMPLAEVTGALLDIGARGMSRPVEIEFAATLQQPPGEPMEFSIVQMRPLILSEDDDSPIEEVDPERVVCKSETVLGVGSIDGIHDVVMVDPRTFERGRSRDAVQEILSCNQRLQKEGRPYLLIAIGRLGSADPWLGIPVNWDHINGVRAIIETGFKDFAVTPSQGSHFFQNLISLGIGYLTVNPEQGEGTLDWDWLYGQPVLESYDLVQHLRLEDPLVVKTNGRRNLGVVLKPEGR